MQREPAEKIANAIMAFIGEVPTTTARRSKAPEVTARSKANHSAAKAALAAGTLALPPGPVGWLTILPEMIAVWKIQAQAVSDIAALYGKKSTLRSVRITQRAIGKGISRWLPIIGAVGVGGYAYYDTVQVAKTAMDLFGSSIDIEPPASDA